MTPLGQRVIPSRLRRAWHGRAFARAVREVLRCQPLARGELPLTVLSMVQSRDTLPYLLALLSFARFVNPARVVVVCDPSMTDADRQTLKSMVPHIELRQAAEFRHPALPVGGCWERLSAITEYGCSSYVIQLDADTVTRSRIDEVRAAVSAGSAFVMGERPNQGLATLEETRAHALQWQAPGQHIQGLAEYLLPQAALSGRHYVRGCAGFTGFHRTAALRERLIEFSDQLHRLTGERWAEWGTEQVASNYLVANLSGTAVLPFPDYGTPDQLHREPRFVHFIGSQRFETGHYAAIAGQVIRELAQAARC